MTNVGGGHYVLPLSVCLSVALKTVCIINSSYSFLAIDLNLCTNVSGILKMCTAIFEEKKNDKITAFLDFEILQFLANTP